MIELTSCNRKTWRIQLGASPGIVHTSLRILPSISSMVVGLCFLNTSIKVKVVEIKRSRRAYDTSDTTNPLVSKYLAYMFAKDPHKTVVHCLAGTVLSYCTYVNLLRLLHTPPFF